MGHVVVGHAVLVANTILDDGVGRAHTLEEIPPVIGVVPRAATDIVVSGTGKLLVGKAVGVASKIGNTACSCSLVVEIIVGIAVKDSVVATTFHLDTRVATTIDIEILDEVITAVVDQAVLSGITDGKTLDVNILGVCRDTETDIIATGYFAAIRLCAEIEDRCLSGKGTDEGTLVLRKTVLVGADCLLAIQPIFTAEQVECVSSGGSRQPR